MANHISLPVHAGYMTDQFPDADVVVAQQEEQNHAELEAQSEDQNHAEIKAQPEDQDYAEIEVQPEDQNHAEFETHSIEESTPEEHAGGDATNTNSAEKSEWLSEWFDRKLDG
ncbi:hypothetical protein SLS53_009354 [Cytospora paraplurivora]|uniref:Uncharacterized protein n=1 Tax=Cytospora paraplurivora TaxID=2898453 RepID=A0AAN9TVB6_9PEZI